MADMPCVQLHNVNKAGPLGLDLQPPQEFVGHTGTPTDFIRN